MASGRQARIIDRALDGGDDRRAVGAGAGAVEAVALLARSRAHSRGWSRAARMRVFGILENERCAALAHDETVAIFSRYGLAAASGGSFWVESAESSEKRIKRLGMDRAVGADA